MKMYYDDGMLDHETGANHPERPDRLRAIHRRLKSADELDLEWEAVGPFELDWVRAVHASDYVETMEALAGETARLDPDTVVSPGSIEAAHLAVGGAVRAVDDLMRGASNAGFAAIRPPGHHAEADRAMGFCLYNNAAIATQYALEQYDVERALILDWDVHHGNGTQNIFYGRSEVLYASIHQKGLFPGSGRVSETGRKEGRGRTVNVALPPGCGDADYMSAVERVFEPMFEWYEPQLVVVSAGYDAHVRDPLAGMNVSTEGFGAMASRISELASEYAGGIAYVLEGGYHLEGLSTAVEATIAASTGHRDYQVGGEAGDRAREVIDQVRSNVAAMRG
jgi:acetoin utilization deacetylase AcuC-like enzyme